MDRRMDVRNKCSAQPDGMTKNGDTHTYTSGHRQHHKPIARLTPHHRFGHDDHRSQHVHDKGQRKRDDKTTKAEVCAYTHAYAQARIQTHIHTYTHAKSRSREGKREQGNTRDISGSIFSVGQSTPVGSNTSHLSTPSQGNERKREPGTTTQQVFPSKPKDCHD